MLEKKTYSNGQKVYELTGNKLTYFFKTGKVKATGPFGNDQMEGEWTFYRETGQLWIVGNFKDGKKEGSWIRYDKKGHLEYEETFKDGKVIRRK